MTIRYWALFARTFMLTVSTICLAHFLTNIWITHYQIPPAVIESSLRSGGHQTADLDSSYLWGCPKALLVFQLLGGLALTLDAWFSSQRVHRGIRDFGKIVRDGANKPCSSDEGLRCISTQLEEMKAVLDEQVMIQQRISKAISHDLRTPLSRIKLRLALMDDTEQSLLIGAEIANIVSILDAMEKSSSPQRHNI